MGQAVGDFLPLAVVVAISPIPIVAMVLMLATPRARTNGTAFAFGWIVGLSVLGAIVLVLATGNATEDSGAPATWVDVLNLLFGLAFILLAVRTWLGRPKRGDEAEMPGWMDRVDDFTTGRSFGAGVVLSAVNPKNLVLTVAGALAIAEATLSDGQEVLALAVFVLIGSLGILTLLGIYLVVGERAAAQLERLKVWTAAHNAAIMTVLLLALGAKLIGDAISGFSS
ncbi:MAG TPA: GAP family protein [Gaiellaceae bacterium]|nr:GAP family protein [Gaiellaceae bacterium]